MKRNYTKEQVEDMLRYYYGSSRVIVAGKVVMDKGEIYDKEWWEKKVEKARKDLNSGRFINISNALMISLTR